MTEETLIDEALSKSPDERARFLDETCADNPELRAAVEARLKAREGGDTIDALPTDLDQTLPADSAPLAGGATLDHVAQTDAASRPSEATPPTEYRPTAEPGVIFAGRYTLQEKIGEGGMGEVWIARQTEPVRRSVALKLIKPGMDSRAVLQRFELERQALALMDHPNIAKVFDAGMTSTGQPFFVMELVQGLALTKFCDEMKLNPRERLELFVPICQAVQHAHQKGVVHRDLKPANILVTIIDAKPMPKVIDFGVAKATAGKLTDESLSTQLGAVVGTLEYMSPEQAGFTNEDIDTRADIYSLGVILYELLTGLRPLDAKRLKQAALTEMIRIIREDEPSKPSTRLMTDDALPSMAALRQIEPRRLMTMLRGELDWVVMKCLEKNRDRRYETASALARDIQRYLADEAVEARPPSNAYRLRKFVNRHRGQVIAASLILLALFAGIIGTTMGLLRADRARRAEVAQRLVADEQRKKAEASEQLANDQRSKAEASEALANDQKAQAEKNAQVAGMQATLALNTVQTLITQANEKLQGPGLYDLREALLEVALHNVDGVADIYDKAPTSKEATTAAALMELGRIYRELGQSAKAFKQFQKALEITTERIKIKKGSDASRRNLALVYSNLGATAEELNRDMKAALDYHLKALSLFEDIDARPMMADSPLPKARVRPELSEAYKLVGVIYYRLGQLDEALPYYRKSFEIAREVADTEPNNPAIQVNLTKCELALAVTADRTGQPIVANELLQSALEHARKLIDARPDDISAQLNLADVKYLTGEIRLFAGQLEAARSEMNESRDLYQLLVKTEPRNVFYNRNLSKALYRLGVIDTLDEKPDSARAHFEAALAIRESLVGASKDNDRRKMELMLSQAQVGQVDAAIATADQLAAGPNVDAELRMYLGRCYAIASRTLPARESERSQSLQERAMGSLRAAVNDGFRDRAYLQGETDFVSLRNRDDFKAMIAELGNRG
jgi:serine/threonine protein kinase